MRNAFFVTLALVALHGVARTAWTADEAPTLDSPTPDASATTTAEAARYGFEIALTPAGPPGRYRLLAAVRDLTSGDVVAAPTMIFAAGEPARASAEIAEHGHTMRVEAQVSEDLQTAEIVYQTIAEHRSLTFARTTITLPPKP